jgi:orotate phosphoribosyltransferase
MNESLADRVRDRACVEGPYPLADGRVLGGYFDEYALAADPHLLKEVALAMRDLLPPSTTVLAGVELGGIPLVVALSLATGLPAVFVRRTRKFHGRCAQIEGISVAGQQVILVDDVIRSGTQLLAMTGVLRAAGAFVQAALCVLERPLAGRAALACHGVGLSSVFTEADLTAAAHRTVAS